MNPIIMCNVIECTDSFYTLVGVVIVGVVLLFGAYAALGGICRLKTYYQQKRK